LRTATAAGAWGAETVVAATPRYEAYPSIAYDGSGRLWVAYEEGGLGWGKDFGAYNTEGIALYQGRAIRIRGFEPDGRRIELAPDVGSVLLGMPRPRVDLLGRQSAEESLDPKLETAKNRAPNQAAQNQQNPRNTLPRLLVDASGRIWLAFRSAHPIWWTPIGTRQRRRVRHETPGPEGVRVRGAGERDEPQLAKHSRRQFVPVKICCIDIIDSCSRFYVLSQR